MKQVQPGGMTKVQEANSMTTKTDTIEGTMAEYVTAVIGGQLFGLRSRACRTCSCRSG
jgi:hypothetical protein